MSHHRRTVAAEPHEPGAGLRYPVPKKVAVSRAHSGARLDSRFVIWARIPYGFFVVVDGRGDHIPAASPLAQVDQAAAFAAEREVRICGGHFLFLACRAFQSGAGFGHSRLHILKESKPADRSHVPW